MPLTAAAALTHVNGQPHTALHKSEDLSVTFFNSDFKETLKRQLKGRCITITIPHNTACLETRYKKTDRNKIR